MVLPIFLVFASIIDPETLEWTSKADIFRPFAELASAARTFGFINVDYQNLNPDGIIRRMPLVTEAEGQRFPSLAFAVARLAAGDQAPLSVDAPVIGSQGMPLAVHPRLEKGVGGWRLTARPSYLVNYAGDFVSGLFPMVNFADVKDGLIDPGFFRDKIVLIGPTAVGLSDVKLTPFGEMPGVLIHANVLQNLLQGNHLSPIGLVTRLAILVALAGLTLFFLTTLPATAGLVALVVLVVLYNSAALLLFLRSRIVIEMVAPTLLIVLQFTAGRFLQMFTNLREAYQSLKERSLALEDSNRRLDQQVKDLYMLNETSTRFASLLDMDLLSRDVLKTFQELWKASAGLIAIVDTDDDPLRPLAWSGFDDEDGRLILYDPQVAMSLNVLREERTIVRDREGRWFTCYLPLLVGSRLWGAVLLRETVPQDQPLQDREQFCHTMLGIAATALENSRLYNLATVDALTRLFVRRYFQIQLDLEFKRVRRHGPAMSVLMIDIDHFKKFNDTFGHQQGDIVLREVSAVVRKTLREIDIPARYGGEEFGVILPNTSTDGAWIVAERIRRNVEGLFIPRFNATGDPLRVTISLGVATFPEMNVASAEQLVRIADLALYKAKEGGRNRAVVADSSFLEEAGVPVLAEPATDDHLPAKPAAAAGQENSSAAGQADTPTGPADHDPKPTGTTTPVG